MIAHQYKGRFSRTCCSLLSTDEICRSCPLLFLTKPRLLLPWEVLCFIGRHVSVLAQPRKYGSFPLSFGHVLLQILLVDGCYFGGNVSILISWISKRLLFEGLIVPESARARKPPCYCLRLNLASTCLGVTPDGFSSGSLRGWSLFYLSTGLFLLFLLFSSWSLEN